MATKGKGTMFARYAASHGPKHLPCPSPADLKAEYLKLKKLGLPDEDALHLMALRAKGAMSTSNTSGGGKLPAFIRVLNNRGFKVDY